jgi:predicted dinucleotide-binding enzyme
MRIAAVNAPDKGRILERWAANGHETVALSLDALLGASDALDADVVLLDLPVATIEATAALSKHFDGKTIVDCSNPGDLNELRSGVGSAAQRIANAFPRASVVKGLNHLTPAAIDHALSHSGSKGSEGYITGYYCGDDGESRQMVAALIDELHLQPTDCGPLSNATLLEAIGLLSGYIERTAPFGPHFAISVIREHGESSPLDAWM